MHGGETTACAISQHYNVCTTQHTPHSTQAHLYIFVCRPDIVSISRAHTAKINIADLNGECGELHKHHQQPAIVAGSSGKWNRLTKQSGGQLVSQASWQDNCIYIEYKIKKKESLWSVCSARVAMSAHVCVCGVCCYCCTVLYVWARVCVCVPVYSVWFHHISMHTDVWRETLYWFSLKDGGYPSPARMEISNKYYGVNWIVEEV